jgi:hypothetical protein
VQQRSTKRTRAVAGRVAWPKVIVPRQPSRELRSCNRMGVTNDGMSALSSTFPCSGSGRRTTMRSDLVSDGI